MAAERTHERAGQRDLHRGAQNVRDVATRMYLSLSLRLRPADVSLLSQAALIHLFQSVHNLGPLHPLLCHSLAQILTLGVRTAEPSEDSLWAGSVRACPWFMGATVAQAADRAQCRKGLGECGPQKGYADNLEAAETIWRAVDASGWPLRWKDVLEKEALFVAFL